MFEPDGIGPVAAALMDELAVDHPYGEIGTVLIIVEIKNEDETVIRYHCNDKRQWVQRAMLREALEVADQPADEYEE